MIPLARKLSPSISSALFAGLAGVSNTGTRVDTQTTERAICVPVISRINAMHSTRLKIPLNALCRTIPDSDQIGFQMAVF